MDKLGPWERSGAIIPLKSILKHIFTAERKAFQAASRLSEKTGLDNGGQGV